MTNFLELNCSSINTTRVSVDDSVKIGITVVIAILLVVGSIGNIITIIVIIKNKCLHIPSNFFIVSLSFSDLTSALICSPLWLYRRTWGFDQWLWGEVTCQMYWVLDFMTNYVTSMHILSFALLRCFAVYFPFKMSIFTKKRVLIYIGVLWLISFLVSSPLFSFMGVVYGRNCQNKGTFWPSCSIFYNGNLTNQTNSEGTCCVDEYNTYMLVVSSIFFYFPELLIIVLSIFIARALKIRQRWRKTTTNVYAVGGDRSTVRRQTPNNVPDVVLDSQAMEMTQQNSGTCHESPTATGNQPKTKGPAVYRGNQSEKGVFTQLGLIVLAFMIGYLPATIYLVWTTASTSGRDYNFDYWFGVVSYLCLRVSECMNPVMYNLGSSNIRKATKQLLKLN